jgi:hypothetical protein
MMKRNVFYEEIYEMKDFSNATKAGLIIMLIAGIIMALLVVVSKPVPNLVAWIFFLGLIISIVSALLVKKR